MDKKTFLTTSLLFLLLHPDIILCENVNPQIHQAVKEFSKSKESYNKSIKLYNNILEKNPKDEEARLGLAELFWYKNLREEAVVELERVLETNPDNIPANYRVGEFYISRSLPDEAINRFKHLLRLFNNVNIIEGIKLDDIYRNLGEAYYEKVDYPKAYEYYQKAITLNPDHVDTHYSLGIYHYYNAYYYDNKKESYNNSYYLAISEFNNVIRVSPQHESAHYYLGLCYYNSDKIDKAAEELQETISINPGNAEAHEWLAYIYLEQGKISEAIKEYERSIRLDPYNNDSRYQLARIFYDEKRYRDAINELEKAAETNSYDKNYHNLLADCYQRVGDSKKASTVLKGIYPKANKNFIIFLSLLILPAVIVFFYGKTLLKQLKEDIQERIEQFYQFRKRFNFIFVLGLAVFLISTGLLEMDYYVKAYNMPLCVGYLIPLAGYVAFFISILIIFFYFDKKIRGTTAGPADYARLFFFWFSLCGFTALVAYYVLLVFNSLYPEPVRQVITSYKWAPVLLGVMYILLYGFGNFFLRIIFKTRPLQKSELRDELDNLIKKSDTEVRDILIMETDRLKMAQGLASGMWKRFRYIYLSSYLIKSLKPSEIKTIFAHELGHLKCNHLRKRFIIVMTILLIIWLCIFPLSNLLKPDTMILIFRDWLPIMVFFIWCVIFSRASRRQESEADRFAAEITGKPEELMSALEKLYLINYIPKKFEKTHPSLEKRILDIKKLSSETTD